MEQKSGLSISYAGSNLTTGITPCHSHRGAELLYVASGKCRLEGVNEVILDGMADTLFVIPPQMLHQRRNLETSRTYHVVFEPEPGTFDLRFRVVNIHGDRMIARWFEDLAALDRESDPELSEILLRALLLRVARREEIGAQLRHIHPKLKQALVYITEHCGRPIEVSSLARIVGVSQSHLNALFRKATGAGIKHYIQCCQMQLARRLLKDPNYNISEVAFRCGFADAHYFSRSFREFHGRSPGSFRQDPFSGDIPKTMSLAFRRDGEFQKNAPRSIGG